MAQLTPAQMDAFAEEAREDFDKIPESAILAVGEVWMKWLMKCGHKRQGRILVEMFKVAKKAKQ